MRKQSLSIPVQHLTCLAFFAAMISSGLCQTQPAAPADPAPAPAQEDKGIMVRMICVQTLSGDEEEFILANKTEDEKWIERGKLTLRSPFVSEWFKVPGGLTHMIRKEKAEFKSFGSFTAPPATKRSIIILLPDIKNKTYRAQVIDPSNLGFQKGKTLVLNYGNVTALVKMGEKTFTLAKGKQIVTDFDANENGTFRLTIGHKDKDKNIVLCYDKLLSSNPKTRKFVLLFPNKDSGLRATSLTEFGPFE
jgi:hypothetical protein